MKRLSAAWLYPAVVVFLLCSQIAGPGGEGNGSETIARGVIVDTAGVPVASVTVQMLPAAHDPVKDTALPSQWQVRTGTDGSYRIRGLSAGTYSVEAGVSATGEKALVRDIEITGDAVTTLVDTGILRKTGTVIAHLSEVPMQVGGYVYLPGTNSYATISEQDSIAGQVALYDVPSGSFTDLLSVAGASGQPADILDDTLMVLSGDTVLSAFAKWNHSRRLLLNTTSTGADVPENVYDFPLLVRLTDAEIDFSEAGSAGEDIRFTTSNGSLLPYEIERWDPVGGRGEVWVRIDTVYGNSNSQSLIMYWGNLNATNVSDASSVFAAADGFAGVWHLSETCDDATGSGNDGLSCTVADTTGVIGPGKRFDGTDSIVVDGLCGTPSSVTLSAWARLDSEPADTGGDVISLGDAVLIRMDYALDSLGVSGIVHEVDGLAFYHVFTQRFLRATGWHLLTFTVDAAASRSVLYIDGEEAGVRTDLDIPINYSGVGSSTVIGNHGNGKEVFSFNGAIDEVRVSASVLSPSYIRLCYMNQKDVDALVVFE